MKLGLHCMDCAVGLARMNAETVDLCVTSPPYDQLRDYTGEGEWNFDKFKVVARELARVLKPGGVIAWNVNDAVVNKSYTGSSFRQCLYFKDECGLLFHQPLIWKKSGVRHPDNNRYHACTEWIWIMTKGKPKTFNPIEDRPNKTAGTNFGKMTYRNKDGQVVPKNADIERVVKDKGRRYNVWDMIHSQATTVKKARNHPAAFPAQLAGDLIISYSNEGDLVLDPFSGSGTTMGMAKDLGREFVGFEISEEYFQMANDNQREKLI